MVDVYAMLTATSVRAEHVLQGPTGDYVVNRTACARRPSYKQWQIILGNLLGTGSHLHLPYGINTFYGINTIFSRLFSLTSHVWFHRLVG